MIKDLLYHADANKNVVYFVILNEIPYTRTCRSSWWPCRRYDSFFRTAWIVRLAEV